MEPNKKTSSKCGDVLHKGSSFLSFFSLLLIVAVFLRMESINKKTEMNELRVSKVESRVEIGSPQTTDHKNEMETPEGHKQRYKRNAPQTKTTPTISLRQVREEIKVMLSQACTSKDKMCQMGPPGPKGDSGPHGYPGYKGEKGATGIPGPTGPLGPKGGPGQRGSQGAQGPQGIKGEMGEQGPIGTRGVKGDVGPIGRPGEKGSIGLKGNKGNRGYTGLQGSKGECIVDPKISIYPVSQDVFINTPAIFYCWVDGQTSRQITWSKLGGVLLSDTTVKDGALHINNVQRSHVGSYMCTANTGYGILKAISNLKLKEPPLITNRPPSQVTVAQGSTLSLCCEASGSPPSKVQWSRAGQSPDSTLVFQEKGCLKINSVKYNGDGDYICQARNRFGLAETTTTVILTSKTASSCQKVLSIAGQKLPNGEYLLTHGKVYCYMTSVGKGWTLIARFSNNDDKNWMKDSGYLWYDQQVAMGTTYNHLLTLT